MIDIVFENNQLLTYGDLDTGDVFQINGRVYMFTDMSNIERDYLSVDLKYGTMHTFELDDKVLVCNNAKLILR